MKEILSTLKWGGGEELISMTIIFWSQASCRQKQWGTCSISNMYCLLGILLARRSLQKQDIYQSCKLQGSPNYGTLHHKTLQKFTYWTLLKSGAYPAKTKVHWLCCSLFPMHSVCSVRRLYITIIVRVLVYYGISDIISHYLCNV